MGAAVRPDLRHGRDGHLAVGRQGHDLIGVGDVQQMMGHARLLRGRRFGRPDIHAAVNGAGIGADDFAPETLGHGDGGGCLPHCCRSTDDNERFAHLHGDRVGCVD